MNNQIRLIFDAYNTTNKPLSKEALKKVAEMNPLLESKCKGKNKGVEFVSWKTVII